jgi:hypothetical protein
MNCYCFRKSGRVLLRRRLICGPRSALIVASWNPLYAACPGRRLVAVLVVFVSLGCGWSSAAICRNFLTRCRRV